MTHDELVGQAHASIRRFAELAMGRMATLWADQKLSLAQISLMFVLANAGTASVREVAERLGIGQSAASLLVDRLVQAQLAQRTEDPSDRRRAIVRLTEQGEALMGRNLVRRQNIHAWLDNQDDTHLTIIINAFMTIQNISDQALKEIPQDQSSTQT